MNWLRNIWRAAVSRDEKTLLHLRRIQFQQLLRNYGRILDLMADAAEKQGGGFVLDSQYVVSLVSELVNLSKAVVFDFMAITGRFDASLLRHMEDIELEGRQILAEHESLQDPQCRSDPTQQPASLPKTVDPDDLARALGSHPVLYRGTGQVVCRGAAAGTVYNLRTDPDPAEFPTGGVWVDSDLRQVVELSRVIEKVTAILADAGAPPSYACRLARSHGIPTIVEMADVTSRLATGDLITVDAEENVVYRGPFPELVQYYKEHSASDGEDEVEYRLLRKVRRRVFPLSLLEVRDRFPDVSDIKTVHDLVYLAHELAGEHLANLAKDSSILVKNPSHADKTPFLLSLGAGANTSIQADRSLPVLSDFVTGYWEFGQENDLNLAKKAGRRIVVLPDKETAVMVMPLARGFDIVDAMMSGNQSNNYIYCRFDSGFWNLDQKFARRSAVINILTHLNFAAAETSRAVTGWEARLNESATGKKLRMLGRVCGFLDQRDRLGWQRGRTSTQIDDFIRNHIA
ncbi:MAG: hypothetical protein A2V70_09840 [Planctomycetes bacterium RBG_13_63_9]|nr:MAG: hypothetical protein A2V70_09840 [Planctomycetes bacterium RBG_13_63_9]